MRYRLFRMFALLLGLGLVLPSFLAAQGGPSSLDLHVIRGTPLEANYQHMLPNYLQRLASEATEKRLLRPSTVTALPCAASSPARLDEINPAPPVMRTAPLVIDYLECK